MARGFVEKKGKGVVVIGTPAPPPPKIRIMLRKEMSGDQMERDENMSIVVHNVTIEEAHKAVEKALRELVEFKSRVEAARTGNGGPS